MLSDPHAIEAVAKAIFSAIYKGDWERLHIDGRKEARMDARSVISAYVCDMGEIGAAQRLATWHWVDRKLPHVHWDDAPDPIKNIMLKKAKAGFEALGKLKYDNDCLGRRNTGVRHTNDRIISGADANP